MADNLSSLYYDPENPSSSSSWSYQPVRGGGGAFTGMGVANMENPTGLYRTATGEITTSASLPGIEGTTIYNQPFLTSPFGAAKTTDDILNEQRQQQAMQAEIANRKAAFDAQQNNMFQGNFGFLNQPMEINPFQVQNGQAIMNRPTYGGLPPMQGGMSANYGFQDRAPQTFQQGQQPQADLGQMYNLFSNPYLAQLATLLFQNSNWLPKGEI